MVVTMNGKYQVPADGPDIYRSFVFPMNLPEAKWIKAVELRPKATSSVHHALFFVDARRTARRLDGKDGTPGIKGMGFLANFGSAAGGAGMDALGSLGGFVPGTNPNKLPGDLAMALPKGSDIVMQVHFHPTGKVETEQAELALYFADKPPSRRLTSIMLPPLFGFGAKLEIPEGEKDFRISDSFELSVPTRAVGVTGHAHYVCREMVMTATLPGGATKVLLHIEDWDLDWQDQYLFTEPVDLPAGTVLRTEVAYDNSAENPENPHQPPKAIRWGRGSTDEMGSITLLVVAENKKDESALQQAITADFAETFVNASGAQLTKMIMQLDDNHDGTVDKEELEAPTDRGLFALIDGNRNGGLERAEVEQFTILRDAFGTFLIPAAPPSPAGKPIWSFEDITGKRLRPFEDEAATVLALVFIATDCPIANAYHPELNRLQRRFTQEGVRFVMVHPHPDTTVQQAQKHAADFEIKAPVVVDTTQSITRRVGASVTPEVFVFKRGQLIPAYQGRIDDRHAGFGKKRPAPTRLDLADALESLISDRSVKQRRTNAVGCFIEVE